MILDLIGPAQAVIYAALANALSTDFGPVFDSVPQDTAPPFIVIGSIDSAPDLSAREQLEKITVEIQYVYRGQDRSVLIAMMKAGRSAIDGQPLDDRDGVAFDIPRCEASTVGTAGADGVTYAGIQNYSFLAQPA